jgi:hypothetical protein
VVVLTVNVAILLAGSFALLLYTSTTGHAPGAAGSVLALPRIVTEWSPADERAIKELGAATPVYLRPAPPLQFPSGSFLTILTSGDEKFISSPSNTSIVAARTEAAKKVVATRIAASNAGPNPFAHPPNVPN